MSESTIPDALAEDLRDYLLASMPAGLSLPEGAVRRQVETTEPPVPRLVILCGNPRRQPRMDATSFVAVSLEYVSSIDQTSRADHEAAAGRLDAWWRGLRAAKRRDVIASRIYLHEQLAQQPLMSIRDREYVTALRGDLMVSLTA